MAFFVLALLLVIFVGLVNLIVVQIPNRVVLWFKFPICLSNFLCIICSWFNILLVYNLCKIIILYFNVVICKVIMDEYKLYVLTYLILVCKYTLPFMCFIAHCIDFSCLNALIDTVILVPNYPLSFLSLCLWVQIAT